MSENCCYSFFDLFLAANGRSWTETERETFSKLDQERRNLEVRRLVDLTNGGLACEDRERSDGVTYTAFWRVTPTVPVERQ